MKSELMYDPYRNQRMKTNLKVQKRMISHLTVLLLTRKKFSKWNPLSSALSDSITFQVNESWCREQGKQRGHVVQDKLPHARCLPVGAELLQVLMYGVNWLIYLVHAILENK